MKKHWKQGISILMSTVLVLGTPTSVYAVETQENAALAEEILNQIGEEPENGGTEEVVGSTESEPSITPEITVEPETEGDGLSGISEENITWELSEDGTLTVRGTGAMENYESTSSTPWYSEQEKITRIVIENGVTSIGAYAFQNYYNLAEIVIADSVTSIGEYAFADCYHLAAVTIPSSVISIGNYAFAWCNNMTAITFQGNAPSIGESAFYSVDVRINYPEDNTTWTNDVKQHYGGVLYWGGGSCGENLHWELSEDGTLSISGTGIMTDYESEYDVPWNNYAYKIQRISIQEGVSSIGAYAFSYLSNFSEITIPESVTKIGAYAFYNVYNLTKITIPSNITSIEEYAFGYCNNVSEITFQGNAPSIGENAFYGIYADVDYPKENETWTNDVMQSYGGTLDWGIRAGSCGENVTWVLAEDGTLTISGSGDMENYASQYDEKNVPWYLLRDDIRSVIIEDGVTSIGDYAWSCCYNIAQITIPSSVTRIGAGAFSDCSNISEIVIPFGVTEIGNNAFSGCYNLSQITISESVTDIKNYAFYSCAYNLTEITIPSSVTHIGEYAFGYCHNLVNITFQGDAPSIGSYAFENVNATVNYPKENETWTEDVTKSYGGRLDWGILAGSCGENVTWELLEDGTLIIAGTGEMKNYGSYYDEDNNYHENEVPWKIYQEQIQTIIFRDGVTSIGAYAFKTFYNVAEIVIPASVTDIQNEAFSYCGNLKKITFEGDAPNISANAFASVTARVSYPKDNVTWTNEVMQNYSGNLLWGIGSCGENVFWELSEDGVLTISGTGMMADYWSDYDMPWNAFKNEIKSIVIEDGITHIGSYIFSYCYNVTEITIPESVTSIGSYAFHSCSSLENITISSNVTSIGSSAFYYCSSLKNIIIPASVTSIGYDAFAWCGNITEITFEGDAPSMEGPIFEGIIAVVHYPQDNETWTKDVMKNCGGSLDWGIRSGICGENLTWELSEDGVLTVRGTGDMQNCTSEYATMPWELCRDKIKSVMIEEGVTSIGTYAFFSCGNISSVTIPSSVTNIGEWAFAYCGLSEITFQGDAPSIDETAFSGIYAVVNYPKNNTTWTKDVMQNYGGTLDWGILFGTCGENAAWEISEDGILTISGSGDMADYDYNSPWYDYTNQIQKIIIEDGITRIGSNAFKYCYYVNEIIIPSSVTNIGTYAFYDCDSLTQITIPENVNTIEAYAFSECSQLLEITIPSSVTSIGEYAFAWDYNVNNITFLGNAPAIGTYAFSSIYATVSYPEYNETWTMDVMQNYGGQLDWNIKAGSCGENAIWELSEDGTLTVSGSGAMTDYESVYDRMWDSKREEITRIVIEEGITSIGAYAFANCYYVDELVIPSSVTSIGKSAFEYCYDVMEIVLPENLTDIGERAFYYCNSLEEITIPASVTSIGAYTFAECNTLREVIISDGVTNIGENAFYYCNNLEAITIPATVRMIGANAFASCYNLNKITFQGDAPSIGENAFSGITSEVYYPVENETWTNDVTQNYGGYLDWGIRSGSCGENLVWELSEDGTFTIRGTGAMTDYDTSGNCSPWYVCRDEISIVVMEEGITSIGAYAFYDCSYLNEITIPVGVMSIGDYIVSSCYNLDLITFLGDAPVIGEYAFSDMHVTVSYPKDNETWTRDVMQNYGGNLDWGIRDGSCGENLTWKLSEDGTLTISGTGVMADYYYNAPWDNFKDEINCIIIEDGVTSIGSYAFYYAHNTLEIIIGRSVTSIGEYAFEYCYGVSSITFEGDVPVIDHTAFSGITARVHYPENNETWTSDVMQNYGGNLDWGIREGSCGENVTWNLSEDGTLTISGTGKMQDYGSVYDEETGDSYYYNRPWESFKGEIYCIIVEDGVTSIGASAFYHMASVSEIVIGSNVTSIGEYACYDCYNMRNITFQGDAPSIAETAFMDVIADVNYPKDNATWSMDVMKNYGGSLDWDIRAGSCGENVFWELSEDGTLTISGTGAMTEYESSEERLWDDRYEEIRRVIIEDGITNIGSYAFYHFFNLEEIIIPNSVTSIGNYAFFSCHNLEKIEIPENVSSIGTYAFYYCYSLRELMIPASVMNINEGAFYECNNLEKITISEGVVNIGESAFCYCNELPEIIIPSSVTNIDAYAFERCYSVQTITFVGDAPSIGENAFEGISAEVYYPQDNETWTIDIMQNYGGSLDWGVRAGSCGENVTWVLSEDGILTISGIGAMTDYEAESMVPWYSFKEEIKGVIIESGITAIGTNAFVYCYDITTITFEGDAPSIGGNVFYGVTADVNYPKDNVTWTADILQNYGGNLDWGVREGSCGENVTWKVTEDGILIVSGTGAIYDYTYDSPWCGFRDEINSIIIEDGITDIGKTAFFNIYNATEIIIGGSVTNIEMNAFDGNHNVDSITFEGDAPTIDPNAFSGVTARVYYPEDNETWTSDVMQGYGGRLDWGIRQGNCGVDVTWELSEDGTLTIRGTGSMANYYYDAPWDICKDEIQAIVIEDGVTGIGAYAFCNCNNVTLITFEGDAPSIDSTAFYGVSADVIYPKDDPTWTLHMIQDYGGNLDWGIRAGSCGESVTWKLSEDGTLTISGTGAMQDYGSVYDEENGYYVYYEGPWQSFRDEIIRIIIEDGVTSVGANAFRNVYNVNEIVIGSSVTSIGEYAFNSSYASNITFEGDAPSIGEYAFLNITADVTYPKDNATWTTDVMQNYGGSLDWGIREGNCGESITWKLSEDGTLTISGTGVMEEYAYENHAPWSGCRVEIKYIIIEDGISRIGAYAFYDCWLVSSITFEGDAPSIGENAFNGVSATVNYPEDNETWTTDVMQNYGGSLDWGIREGSCGENVTWNLSEDGTLTIGGTGAIEEYAYENRAPWSGCRVEIKYIIIEDGISRIGAYAFYDCYDVTSITFKGDAPSVGEYAFEGVYARVYYPEDNVTWTSDVMQDYGETLDWGIREGSCGENVTWNLSEDGMLTISGTGEMSNYYYDTPWYGFRDEINYISIGAGVTGIGAYAFVNCWNINSITFEGDAPNIDGTAFLSVTAEVNYPENNVTWTSDMMQDYGGTLDWGIREGSCGENVTWNLSENGTMTISGSGAMSDYADGDAPWYGFRDEVKSIVVEEGITSVGSYAFYSCNSVTEIIFSNTVINIKESAFYDCYDVTELIIPSSVRSIEAYAFASCYASSITFEGDAPRIDGTAFYYVSAKVSYPKDNGTWTADVMQNYGGNLDWDIRSGICGDNAFWELSEDGTLTISGTGAMTDYEGDYERAWNSKCSEVIRVIIEDGITNIGAYAFYDCHNLEEIVIPATVTSIGAYAFYGCWYISEIVIPTNVTSIGAYAFYDCNNLKEITIPDGVASIEDYTFYYCNSFNEIVIPASVTKIGNHAFDNCYYISSITFEGDAPSIAETAFNEVESIVYYPEGNETWTRDVMQNYGGYLDWGIRSGSFGESLTWELSEDGILTISGTGTMPDYGYYYDENTSIGHYRNTPWDVCSNLIYHIVIEAGVSSIGKNAFDYLSNLETVTFKGDVPAIAEFAFIGCYSVKMYYPEGNETWISDVMLNYGGSLDWGIRSGSYGENLTWELSENGTLTIRGTGAMEYYDYNTPWYVCRDEIKRVIIEDGVTTIADSSYAYCQNLTEVIIGASVVSIESWAFEGCNNLQKITFQGDRPEIGRGAFYEVTAEVYYPEGNATWTVDAMQNYDGLLDWGIREGNCGENLTWNLSEDGILTISGSGSMDDYGYYYDDNGDYHENYAPWYACKNKILHIVIKEGVTSIGANAFYECDNANTITFEGDVPSISETAFKYTVLDVNYPEGNETWTRDVMQNYGGVLDWGIRSGSCGENLTWELSEDGILTISGSGSMDDYGYYYDDNGDYHENYAPWYACQDEVQSVVIGEGVMSIGEYAFEYCYGIISIIFQGNAPKIAETAFWNVEADVNYPEGNETWTLDAMQNYGGCLDWGIRTGSCGENLTWELSKDGTMTIRGTGTMDNYSWIYNYEEDRAGNTPWYACHDEIERLIVEEGVTSIGECAFGGCDSLTQITFKGDAPRIKSDAFGNVVADVYYPEHNTTWTDRVMKNYGGELTWFGDGSEVIRLEIITQPTDVRIDMGETAKFHVEAIGTNLTYQWQWSPDNGITWKDSSSSTIGYNADTLQIQATALRNGYLYRCVITDDNEVSVTTDVAALYVHIDNPLTIMSQPSDQTAEEGKMVSFVVTAEGEGLTYQWQWSHDGGSTWKNSSSATVGYNEAALYVQATALRNGYLYRCVIQDANGVTVTTETATLYVEIKKELTIINQPSDQTADEGKMVSFVVTAEGEGLTYQWQWSHDGGTTWKNSSSATIGYNEAALYIQATAVRNGYLYRCVITDADEVSVTTETVKLNVNVENPLTITSQPSDQTADEGKMVSFAVTAEGEGLIYQWQWSHDGGTTWKNSSSATVGYNEATLYVQATEVRNGYLYRCIITDAKGVSVTTEIATLYVEIKKELTIINQPSDQTADEGKMVSFVVKAEGEGLTYQWQWSHDGGSTWKNSSSATIGYNEAALYVQATAVRNGYLYRCVITDADEVSVTTETVKLNVNVENPLTITSQPSDQTAEEGKMVSFAVTAEGEGLTYQWQWSHDGGTTWKNSSSATIGYNEATLYVQGTAARNGYVYRCVITDANEVSVTTETAKLSVNIENPLTITSQPSDQTAEEGTMVSFVVAAEGEGLTYQWQWSHDGGSTWKDSSSATIGYNEATLYVQGTAARNGYLYRCVITDANGVSVLTDIAALVLKGSIIITAQPSNQSGAVHTMAVFTVNAVGEGLSYQWQWSHDGGSTWKDSSSATLGYNTDTLQVTITDPRNGYQYRCVITDNEGVTVTTKVATLTVQ